jgi:hypothetical protein
MSRLRGDYRRGMDWWMDSLTTNTNNMEHQVITVLLLIFTFYKSLLKTLSLLQPSVSTAVSWQRLLTVEILQFLALRSFLSGEYPASELSQFRSVKVKVTLQLEVYRGLRRQAFEDHDHRFFQLKPCDNSSHVTSSLTRRFLCLLLIPLSWPGVLVIASGRPRRKHHFQLFFCFCYGRLPSNSPDIVDDFNGSYQATAIVSLFVSRSLASNRSIGRNTIT